MGKYKNINGSRLTVKYINADTDEEIFEVKNRNHSNVGELLTEHFATEVIKVNVKNNIPENLMILVIGEYNMG